MNTQKGFLFLVFPFLSRFKQEKHISKISEWPKLNKKTFIDFIDWAKIFFINYDTDSQKNPHEF